MSELPPRNSTPLPTPPPSWPRTVAFGLVLLVCGAVIGSGLTVIAIHKHAERGRGDPAWMMKRTANRIVRELDLTSEQAEKVRAIFAKHRENVRAFRMEHELEAREVFGALQKEIEDVLTPAQARKWREHMRRAREHALHEGPRFRGRPPPPRHERPPHGDRFQRRDGPPPEGRPPRRPGGPPRRGERPPPREGPPPD